MYSSFIGRGHSALLSVLRDLALHRHALGDVPDGVWGPASVTLTVSSRTSKAGSEVSFSSAPCFKSLRRDFALSRVCSVPRGDPAPTWKPRCQQEIEGHFTKSTKFSCQWPSHGGGFIHSFLWWSPRPGHASGSGGKRRPPWSTWRRPASQARGLEGCLTRDITAWSPDSLPSTHPRS